MKTEVKNYVSFQYEDKNQVILKNEAINQIVLKNELIILFILQNESWSFLNMAICLVSFFKMIQLAKSF